MDRLQAPHPLTALLLLCGLLSACGEEASPDAGPTDAPSAEQAIEIEWLDDEGLARSAAFHQLGGRITAPASAEDSLPRQARQALVARAKALGFARLDNLQFAMDCGGDAEQDGASGDEDDAPGAAAGAAESADGATSASAASTPAAGGGGCTAEIAAIASR